MVLLTFLIRCINDVVCVQHYWLRRALHMFIVKLYWEHPVSMLLATCLYVCFCGRPLYERKDRRPILLGGATVY